MPAAAHYRVLSMKTLDEFYKDVERTAAPASEEDFLTNSPAHILDQMAETYRERNKVYGDNFLKVGAVFKALYPNGLTLTTEDDFTKFHLFMLLVVKLTRFTNSNLTHQDSIHDIGVYAAMIDSLLRTTTPPQT